MTPENFCYWLQGYFELYGPKTLDEKETRIVWDHLNLVFNKVTPDRSGPLNYGDGFRGFVTNLDKINTKSSNFENPVATGEAPKPPSPFFLSKDVYGKPHPFSVHSDGPNGFQLEFKPNTIITC
jgi:hypothetical protein